jgi:polysaccharide biosynthesis protein PslH
VRRIYQWLDNSKATIEERTAWQRMDAILTTSRREAAIIGRVRAMRGVFVVPNGVDTEYLQPSMLASRPGSIVFTGLMAYRPNADAVRWFTHEMLPRIRASRPDVTFTVVGKDVPAEVAALVGDGVTVTGWVADVRPYLSQAEIVVVPLRAGSGTRIKILEAFAMGRPVISTTIGAEGIEARPGDDLFIADTPVEFADAVVRLLDDPAAAARLARSGRKLVERLYAWSGIVERLEPGYQWIVADPAAE